MLFHSITLKNFLSFGEEGQEISLGPLNILIGPNGSGKSNFISAFEILQAAPRDIWEPIRRSGSGIQEWMWREGENGAPISIESIVMRDEVLCGEEVKYSINISQKKSFPIVSMEYVESNFGTDKEDCSDGADVPNREFDISELDEVNMIKLLKGRKYTYKFVDGTIVRGADDDYLMEDIDSRKSILSQVRGNSDYREISELSSRFDGISVFRDWEFGRSSVVRDWQRADHINDRLDEDFKNLGVVLNRLSEDFDVKEKILSSLRTLYPGIEDFGVSIQGNRVQIYFREGRNKIPATRLSDGTLRFLCLLVILCDPSPPPLICIEEPELGLHPDVISTLADLLKEASERTQIIVTTHSDMLVDAMSDLPEAILVAERDENGTKLNRLDPEELKPWLEKYRLGQLWMRGDIGGTRW